MYNLSTLGSLRVFYEKSVYNIRRNTVFLFPVHMRKFKKSLAHGQVPTDFLLARSEKSLAPGVGQSDLSAPALASILIL